MKPKVKINTDLLRITFKRIAKGKIQGDTYCFKITPLLHSIEKVVKCNKGLTNNKTMAY